jgi:hypothetical protein
MDVTICFRIFISSCLLSKTVDIKINRTVNFTFYSARKKEAGGNCITRNSIMYSYTLQQILLQYEE